MSQDNDTTTGWWQLGIAMVAIGIVWGFVLPRLERAPTIQDRIRHLDTHGIDPAAFFYSDHPAMNRWEAAIRQSHEETVQSSQKR